MKPVSFEYQNAVAGKGQEGVGELPMFRHEHGVITCWEMTEEELQEVIKTRRVWVSALLPKNSPIPPMRVESDISGFFGVNIASEL